MNKELVIKTLDHICDKLISNADVLTELDRKIGDGDHGINIKRGFSLIKETLKTLNDCSLKELFNKCAMVIMTKVGGASGPLLATAFMKMANEETLEKMLLKATEGIKMRGKAKVGEKTMLDILEPCALIYQQERKNNKSHCEAMNALMVEAKKRLAMSKDLIATKGRASYLGKRSIGTIDPGTQTIYFIFEAIKEQTCK